MKKFILTSVAAMALATSPSFARDVKIDAHEVPTITLENGVLSDLTYSNGFVIPGPWDLGIDTQAAADRIHVEASDYINEVYETGEIRYNVGPSGIKRAINQQVQPATPFNADGITREEFMAQIETAIPLAHQPGDPFSNYDSSEAYIDFVMSHQASRADWTIRPYHARYAKTLQLLETEAVAGACEVLDASSKRKHVEAGMVTPLTASLGENGRVVFAEGSVESCGNVVNPAWVAAAKSLENDIADDLKNGQKLVANFEHFSLFINTSTGGVEVQKEFIIANDGDNKLTITPRLGLHLSGLGGDANVRSYGTEVAYETTLVKDALIKLGYDTGTHFDFTQGTKDGFRGLRGNGNTGDYGFVYVEQGAEGEVKVTVKADTQSDWALGLKKGPYSASVNQDGKVSASYTIKF